MPVRCPGGDGEFEALGKGHEAVECQQRIVSPYDERRDRSEAAKGGGRRVALGGTDRDRRRWDRSRPTGLARSSHPSNDNQVAV